MFFLLENVGFIKVKLYLCLSKHYATEVQLILGLVARWRLVVSFRLRQFYPGEKPPVSIW
jgi:hypothetical protein